MKSLVIAPTLHSSNWRVFAETLAFIILGGFHRWNLGELCWISQVKSLVIAPTLHSSNWRVFAETLAFIILGGFHRWNLGEIHQISWLKSTRFQGEIHQISRVKSPTLHSSNWRVFAKTFAFIILGGFHRSNLGEICQISWVKSPTLHSSNWRVFAETLAFIIMGGFHRWYLGEIRRISGWNPPDFMNVSFWVMIKYRSFYRKTKNRGLTCVSFKEKSFLATLQPHRLYRWKKDRLSLITVDPRRQC